MDSFVLRPKNMILTCRYIYSDQTHIPLYTIQIGKSNIPRANGNGRTDITYIFLPEVPDYSICHKSQFGTDLASWLTSYHIN